MNRSRVVSSWQEKKNGENHERSREGFTEFTAFIILCHVGTGSGTVVLCRISQCGAQQKKKPVYSVVTVWFFLFRLTKTHKKNKKQNNF